MMPGGLFGAGASAARHRRVAAVVLTLVVLGIGANAVRRALRGKGSRYDENVGFSRELVYEDLDVYEIHPPKATHTKYPPTYFVYVAPFVPLPTGLGAALWFLLNAALGIACVVLAVRLAWPVDAARPPPPTAYALAGAAIAWLLITNGSTSQVNIQITFFVLWGLRLVQRGREAWGGATLAVAVVLKLTPALLLVWLALRRRWRVIGGAALGGLAAAAVVALVLGPARSLEVTRSWLDVLLPFAREGVLGEGIGGVRHTNQSLAAGFFRFATDIPAGGGLEGLKVNLLALPYETATSVVKALNVLLLLASFAVIGLRRPAAGAARFAPEAALLMTATLLISPISWINHHVALVLPYAVLLQAWRDAPAAERRGRAAWCAAAVLLMLTSVWPLLMAFSLPLLGTLILGVLLARRVRTSAAG